MAPGQGLKAPSTSTAQWPDVQFLPGPWIRADNARVETGVDWAFWNLLSTGLVLSSVTRFPSGYWVMGGSEQMTAALQSPWGLAKYVGGRVNPEHFHLYFNPVPFQPPREQCQQWGSSQALRPCSSWSLQDSGPTLLSSAHQTRQTASDCLGVGHLLPVPCPCGPHTLSMHLLAQGVGGVGERGHSPWPPNQATRLSCSQHCFLCAKGQDRLLV